MPIQSGKLYQAPALRINWDIWGVCVDQETAHREDAIVYMHSPKDEFYLAIKKAKIDDFDKVHCSLRQEYRGREGYLFLYNETRVWVLEENTKKLVEF